MGLFSRKKAEVGSPAPSHNLPPPINQVAQGGIPDSLPDTLMDRMTGRGVQAKQLNVPFVNPVVLPQRDINDEHKRIPADIVDIQPKPRGVPMEQVKFLPIQEPVQQPIQQPVTQPMQDMNVPESVIGSIEASFFSEMEKKFLSDKETFRSELHEFISNELVHKMKDYHDSMKSGGAFFMNESDIDRHAYRKIIELKELEAEWLMRRREFEVTKDLLAEKEAQIASKLGDFRKVLRGGERFKLYNRKAPEQMAFKLNNSKLLFSIQELLYSLPEMPDEVFKHHVNDSRNDFASWILNVFHAPDLAGMVEGARSKDALIEALKNF